MMPRRKAESGGRQVASRVTRHTSPDPDRRRFMLGAAGLTFGIAAGVPALLDASAARAQGAKSVALNAWVTLDTDGTVTILSPASEMGHGSRTALPVILADAMDADWTKVNVVPAPPRGTLYGNPSFGGEQYASPPDPWDLVRAPISRYHADPRYACVENDPCYFEPFGAALTPVTVVGHFDVTDAYMRARKQDPYRHEKAQFLERTREARLSSPPGTLRLRVPASP